MNTVKPESIALFLPDARRRAAGKTAGGHAAAYLLHQRSAAGRGVYPLQRRLCQRCPRGVQQLLGADFYRRTGIAVRVLAPLVNDKLSDPAVVVIDERARHVISLLSGHAGGANALTRYLAGMLDADPVITTATDVNELAALDTLAFQLNARMTDFRAAVKTVNQMLVSGKRVGLWCDGEFTGALSRCDRRGFIPVSDLARLPRSTP